MTTEATIKILILEDLAADRELLLHELRHQGVPLLCLPAGNEEEYLAALERQPDIVLADYHLPGFSARQALDLLNERGLPIPLIVISGMIGEEKAVEMMRHGAADYLLKDRLARLGAAVMQAIGNSRLSREKQLSEAALRFSEERFRLAVNRLPHPFVLYDEALRIRFVNTSGTRFFGLPEARILGRDAREFFPDEVTRQFLPALMAAQESQQPRTVDCVIPLPAGERSFQLHYVPLLKENGELAEILGIAVDITEWQHMERLKDELLASVSHEMRSPLTAILGFSEFMLAIEVPRATQMEYLGIIQQESERLKELVENLLDLQRLQAGFDNLGYAPLVIHTLLSSVLNRFAAMQKKHAFMLDCPVDLPLLEGHEAHLYRALENLLSNAVKYSAAGGNITLGARSEDGDILLWVKDQGQGIPEAARERIFQRFFRLGTDSGGTGLGLALVREIAEEHRGKVWVESEPGRGSVFYLRLPLRQSAEGN